MTFREVETTMGMDSEDGDQSLLLSPTDTMVSLFPLNSPQPSLY